MVRDDDAEGRGERLGQLASEPFELLLSLLPPHAGGKAVGQLTIGKGHITVQRNDGCYRPAEWELIAIPLRGLGPAGVSAGSIGKRGVQLDLWPSLVIVVAWNRVGRAIEDILGIHLLEVCTEARAVHTAGKFAIKVIAQKEQCIMLQVMLPGIGGHGASD